METKIIGKDNLNEAASLIAAGQLVAVPTETVYGLACSGLDADAVEQVYEVKGRPEVKPLSLMLHKGAAVTKYCANVPKQARVLMDKFWPGPLTIVLKSKDIGPRRRRYGRAKVPRPPDDAGNAEKSALAVCRSVGKSVRGEKPRYGAGGARILRWQNCRRRGRRKMRSRKRVNHNRHERGTV